MSGRTPEYLLKLKTLLPVFLICIPCQGIPETIYVDSDFQVATTANIPAPANRYINLLEASRALKPGDELVISGGVYRDSIVLPNHNWLAAGPTIIRSRPGESVLITGSDIVTGWENLGDGLFVKYDWQPNSQQVFIDGRPLTQIGGSIFSGYPDQHDHQLSGLHPGKGIWPGRKQGGADTMPEYSFYMDVEKKQLFIRLPKHVSASEHLIEASVRTRLLEGRNLDSFIIRDLSFRHSNSSSTGRGGAVHLLGDSIIVDNIQITLTDSVGMVIRGNHNRVSNSKFNSCGQLGLVASGHFVEITNNETSGNNTRGFNKYWAAGGVKFGAQGGLHDSIISSHSAFNNNGDGIWVDWKNTNITIRNSITAYNQGDGIHYEASATGKIENNYSFANAQRGIYLPHSSRSVIDHNLVALNKLEGIAIIDAGREDPEHEMSLRPVKNMVVGNILAWNNGDSANLVFPEKLLDNQSDYNLFITDSTPVFSMGWPTRSFMKKGRGLNAWRRISGQDSHSWSVISFPDRQLLASISNKVRNIDWTPLRMMATEYKVPANAPGSDGESKPGPGKP